MTDSRDRQYDAVIIGGGAAGLMCAIAAGKRGRKVAVLEQASEIGKKILISGGGRCNFTNIHCSPENFLSANPHFSKSALARYTPSDFLALVKKHRIPYHEKKLGQLFCDRSARDITGMLRAESEAAGVDIVTACSISEVRKTTGFVAVTSRGSFHSPSLVIAAGGLSIPKMGATDFGYRVAKQFGVHIRPCRPALVPLTFNEEDHRHYGVLAGVSADVTAGIGARRFRENLLFTHRGLSGPAILQISSYWSESDRITVDLLPDVDIRHELLSRKRRHEKAGMKAVLSEFLPNRFAERWVELNAPAKSLPAFADHELEDLARKLHQWEVLPKGTEGYAKAEVTAGGVDTNELSSKTMECKKAPGLYFIGEVVDVTGHLGGFNFQWAWASGHAAGEDV